MSVEYWNKRKQPCSDLPGWLSDVRCFLKKQHISEFDRTWRAIQFSVEKKKNEMRMSLESRVTARWVQRWGEKSSLQLQTAQGSDCEELHFAKSRLLSHAVTMSASVCSAFAHWKCLSGKSASDTFFVNVTTDIYSFIFAVTSFFACLSRHNSLYKTVTSVSLLYSYCYSLYLQK